MASNQRHQHHLSSYLKSKKESPTKGSSCNSSSKSHLKNRTFHGKETARSRGRQTCNVDSIPDELLITIFRLLSPSHLLICAQVCHRWADMTKDGSLWEGVFPKLPQEVRKLFKFEETRTEGFDWKKEMIQRNIKARNNMVLRPVKGKQRVPFGLPGLQGHLKFLSVKWKLCFVDTSGNEHWTPTGKQLFYASSSVSVHWPSLDLPALPKLKTMKIFAFVPVFYNKSWKVHQHSATSRSLVLEYNMKLTENAPKQKSAVAEDDMITVHTLPQGVVLACWKASWKVGGELAFVNANIHHHNLRKRILLGSSTKLYQELPHKPVFDDIDPQYGLHGYSADLALRDNDCSFWSHHYRQLYGGDLTSECVVFTCPGVDVFKQKIVFPWKTELFNGTLPNACILDVTVVDEHRKPMWCISSLVKARLNSELDVDYSTNGEKYTIEYSDETGIICLDLVLDPDIEQIFVTKTDFHIRKSFVNKWFGTRY